MTLPDIHNFTQLPGQTVLESSQNFEPEWLGVFKFIVVSYPVLDYMALAADIHGIFHMFCGSLMQ